MCVDPLLSTLFKRLNGEANQKHPNLNKNKTKELHLLNEHITKSKFLCFINYIKKMICSDIKM